MNLISIAQFRELIYQLQCSEKPLPFSITFWTANRKENTGGDGIELKNCMLMKNQFGRSKITDKPNLPKSEKLRRDPNHHIHNTFNVIHNESQNKFCVHFDLVTEYNQKQIVPNVYE